MDIEKMIEILNIGNIERLYLRFKDNNGNFKEINIDYPCENCCDKGE